MEKFCFKSNRLTLLQSTLYIKSKLNYNFHYCGKTPHHKLNFWPLPSPPQRQSTYFQFHVYGETSESANHPRPYHPKPKCIKTCGLGSVVAVSVANLSL
jgi:hypothetical protein